jgi:arsenate reductase
MHNLARLVIGAFCFILLSLSQTNAPGGAEPTVLFVCEHGAAKSIIAAAEFNRIASQRGLAHRAISRGTNPDPQFAPGVIAGLRKDGLSVPSGKPQLLTAADIKKADRVVTLGCKLPEPQSSAGKTADWSDIASPSQSYDAARKDIARHVQQLVDELAHDPAKK